MSFIEDEASFMYSSLLDSISLYSQTPTGITPPTLTVIASSSRTLDLNSRVIEPLGIQTHLLVRIFFGLESQNTVNPRLHSILIFSASIENDLIWPHFFLFSQGTPFLEIGMLTWSLLKYGPFDMNHIIWLNQDLAVNISQYHMTRMTCCHIIEIYPKWHNWCQINVYHILI